MTQKRAFGLGRTLLVLLAMIALAGCLLAGCSQEQDQAEFQDGTMSDDPTAELSGKESMELAEEQAVPVDELGPSYMDVAHGAFIIADDKACTIRCTSKDAQEGFVGYSLAVTNNHSAPIRVYASNEANAWLANGEPICPSLDEALEPGETAEVCLQFSLQDVEDPEAVANVDGAILVEDRSTGELLNQYDVKLA